MARQTDSQSDIGSSEHEMTSIDLKVKNRLNIPAVACMHAEKKRIKFRFFREIERLGSLFEEYVTIHAFMHALSLIHI